MNGNCNILFTRSWFYHSPFTIHLSLLQNQPALHYNERVQINLGLFITFEGGEGTGKSTQCRLLAEYLQGAGYEVVSTHEPGGSGIGAQIRSIVLDPAKPLYPQAEVMLYMADRAQHIREVIQPALDAGRVVISDRYADASLAYQGYGRGLPLEMIARLNDYATAGLEPAITFLLDMDVKAGICRVRSRCNGQPMGDRIEQEPLDFHQRVRNGYLKIAAENPSRYRVIDAALAVTQVREQIIQQIQPLLRK